MGLADLDQQKSHQGQAAESKKKQPCHPTSPADASFGQTRRRCNSTCTVGSDTIKSKQTQRTNRTTMTTHQVIIEEIESVEALFREVQQEPCLLLPSPT